VLYIIGIALAGRMNPEKADCKVQGTKPNLSAGSG
jgi:hypothetical protein